MTTFKSHWLEFQPLKETSLDCEKSPTHRIDDKVCNNDQVFVAQAAIPSRHDKMGNDDFEVVVRVYQKLRRWSLELKQGRS